MNDKNPKIATHKIEDLVKTSPSDHVAIFDLVRAMEGAGFGLTLMIFSFGILIPLPPPFPSLIAVPLVIFSFQMMIGLKAPKLPNFIGKRKIKRSILITLVRKSAPYIGKVERILRPRLIFMTTILAERFLGLFTLAFSSFVLIPVPFSNLIPGLGILIISFGLIGRDGLVIILGIVIGFIGMAIFLITLIFGLEVFNYIFKILF